MLMEAFDDDGRYITSTVIITQVNMMSNLLYIKAISKKGKPPRVGFWTSASKLLRKQEELGFKIINRSGQCLSFLGDNT